MQAIMISMNSHGGWHEHGAYAVQLCASNVEWNTKSEDKGSKQNSYEVT